MNEIAFDLIGETLEKCGMLDGKKFYDKSQCHHGILYFAKYSGKWGIYLCKDYVSGYYPANGNSIKNKGFFLIYPESGGLSRPKSISSFDEIKCLCNLDDCLKKIEKEKEINNV